MNVRKRGNSYRVEKMINGKRYSMTFDHEPKKNEVLMAFAQFTEKKRYGKKTFTQAAAEYINLKKNIYSPATLKEYYRKINRLPDNFKTKYVDDITKEDIQAVVNDMAADKSPKTVRDMHAFISAVMKMCHPEVSFKTLLPQKTKPNVYIPTDKEVKALLEYAKTEANGMFYVPISLGVRSIRRSEICALTVDDLDDNNIITVNKALVEDHNKKWVIKTTKTTDSARMIPIPADVADIIREQGYVYNGYPGSISNFIDRYCKKFGVNHFSLHKCRHYFASRLLSENIDTETVKDIGGWKTDYVLKTIYAHSIDEKVNEALSKLDDILL